jgi:AbrB family looped-hinge helix DNA binding protein
LKEKVEALFMGQSKMTQRGQVSVPVEVRRKFNLKPGDVLCFFEVNGSVFIKLGPIVLTE